MKEYTVYWRHYHSNIVNETSIQSWETIRDAIIEVLDQICCDENLMPEEIDICHVEVVR